MVGTPRMDGQRWNRRGQLMNTTTSMSDDLKNLVLNIALVEKYLDYGEPNLAQIYLNNIPILLIRIRDKRRCDGWV